MTHKQTTSTSRHARAAALVFLAPAIVIVIGVGVGTAHAQPATAPDDQPATAPDDPAPTPIPDDAVVPALAPDVTAGAAVDSMTLARVLEVAVRQKPSLEQAAIDVAIADAQMMAIVGADDWFFDVTGRLSSTRLQAFGLDQDSLTVDANLSRRLSTGGTVTLHADTGYTSATTSGLTREIYAHTVSGSLAQPLLRGRGKRIAHAERRRSAIARDAATLAHRMEAITTVRQVIGGYWELAYAWRDLEIRKSSLALAQERLRNTQAAIDAGAVAPTEALAVEQSIVSREEAILGAEHSLSRLSLDLRRRAGLEIGPSAIDLQVAAPVTIPERVLDDISALIERAWQVNPTLARLQALEGDARLDVELTENGLLPELELVVSFGPTGSADNPATAFESMVRFDDLSASASLTYRQSIGNRQAKGMNQQAHARLRRQRIGTEDVKAQVSASLVLEVKRAQAARKRFDLGARAIVLAQKNVEAEKARFELGRATNFDVMQRQDELEQAQLRQARALIDFMDAMAAVDALTGDILEQYGITLELQASH